MGVLHVPYGSTHYLTGQNRSSGQFVMGHITCEEERVLSTKNLKVGRDKSGFVRVKGRYAEGGGFVFVCTP